MNDMIHTIHFEDLWLRCEKLSPTADAQQALGQMAASIAELRDIYKVAEKSTDKRLVQGMKEKAVGRLLMTLTSLSAIENIDVYAALKDQWNMEQAKNALLHS